MRPQKGIALAIALLSASCQVQNYIANEDMRIYNTPVGKLRTGCPAPTADAPSQESWECLSAPQVTKPACQAPSNATPQPATPAATDPQPAAASPANTDWTEEEAPQS